ncbi:MAG: indole-3-glycerol-phosphate synthase [Gammaproteobacteria bacterium]|nr:indole-3-glycerol-phosphate synthase [Gammaproteobacteria bacterium]
MTAGSLTKAIRAAREAGRVPVIADIKPVSPRDGDLLAGRRPADLAAALTAAGACALSVVTESRHFGGSCDTLAEVVGATPLPVLRKDFITDQAQLRQTADAGAAAVLLIVATIPSEDLAPLFDAALDLGLEPLVEVHTEAELARALALSPALIGINNRDILRLETDAGDVTTTVALAPRVPEGIVIVSESSLLTDEDVRRALGAGADAVLVGTMLLHAADPAARLAALTQLPMVRA